VSRAAKVDKWPADGARPRTASGRKACSGAAEAHKDLIRIISALARRSLAGLRPRQKQWRAEGGGRRPDWLYWRRYRFVLRRLTCRIGGRGKRFEPSPSFDSANSAHSARAISCIFFSLRLSPYNPVQPLLLTLLFLLLYPLALLTDTELSAAACDVLLEPRCFPILDRLSPASCKSLASLSDGSFESIHQVGDR
jgi:hypothetical protein